jgi:hypothetical protein
MEGGECPATNPGKHSTAMKKNPQPNSDQEHGCDLWNVPPWKGEPVRHPENEAGNINYDHPGNEDSKEEILDVQHHLQDRVPR